jgi:hypothetical protein
LCFVRDFASLGLIEIGYDDATCPIGCKPARHRCTDPVGAASHHHDLALNPHAHSPCQAVPIQGEYFPMMA